VENAVEGALGPVTTEGISHKKHRRHIRVTLTTLGFLG